MIAYRSGLDRRTSKFARFSAVLAMGSGIKLFISQVKMMQNLDKNSTNNSFWITCFIWCRDQYRKLGKK